MKEVSGPIIAIALVLCAVFVPMAFLTGVTGQFYKQFAVTIAISTVISAINSLTLSPALAARLLQAARRAEGRAVAPDRAPVRLGVPSVQPLLQAQLGPLPGRRCRACWAVAARCSPCTPCCWSPPRLMFQAVPRGFIPTPGQAVPDRRREAAGRRFDRAHRCGAEESGRDRDEHRGRRSTRSPSPA